MATVSHLHCVIEAIWTITVCAERAVSRLLQVHSLYTSVSEFDGLNDFISIYTIKQLISSICTYTQNIHCDDLN